ncbi:MAG: alpha/beta fold hydrolase [Ancrocorticia sp.]
MAVQDVLVIHGTWGHGGFYEEFAAPLREMGYNVHTPTLPYHGNAQEIDVEAYGRAASRRGLLDNVEYLRGVVDKMATPPIIMGHSLGGLYAQLLGSRVENRGLVLLGTAPGAGIFAEYPTTTRIWARYVPRMLTGRPMPPLNKKVYDALIANNTDRAASDEAYAQLCHQSGTVYRDMAFFFLDRKRSARVDYDAIQAPVLLIVGEQDKCCTPRMIKAIAKKFGGRATYAEVPVSGHQITVAPHLAETMSIIRKWLGDNALGPTVA